MPDKLDYFRHHSRFHKSIPHASYYPIISNVVATNIGASTINITWDTDKTSTSQVKYGFVPYLGFESRYDSNYVTSHGIALSGLLPNTLYYFRVESFNQDALSISDLYVFSFTVAAYPAFILTSPDATRWAIFVTTDGNLLTVATPSGPGGAFEPVSITLKDPASIYWALTISNQGNLITTSGASSVGALDNIFVTDSLLNVWGITVKISGDLQTA